MEQGIVEIRKNYKRNKILGTIRYNHEISRFDVKKLTGYSMVTVLSIINELVGKRLLLEEECDELRVGRKPVWLSINPDGQYAIGVEFNADSLTCVVIDFLSQPIFSSKDTISSLDSVEDILEKIKHHIRNALSFLGERKERVLGIGIGIPGCVDKQKGISVGYAHIKGWHNIPVQKILEDEFGYRVVLENNVNTLTVAYRWTKYSEKSDDFILVSMRYGTRIGMIIGNRLFSGSGGNAGEIAHMRLANGSRLCSCGKIGCLDTEVSCVAMRHKIAERINFGLFKDIAEMVGNDTTKISLSMLMESAFAGNEDSIMLLNETASYLGQCLSAVIATVNPKRIVIESHGGPSGKHFSDEVFNAIQLNIAPALVEGLSVKCIDTQEIMGAIGAAMMSIEEEYQILEQDL